MKNHSVKKSVLALGLGLILGSSVITGCSLVTRNNDKYYAETAALLTFKDGSEIRITRKDLRAAYAQYSFSQYVEYGYYTQDEAYEKALDFLVSQKLAVRDAEIKSRKENADNQTLTAKEKTYLWEKTVDAMLSNIDSYTSSSDEEEDETSADAITRETYSREAELMYDEETKTYYLQLPESAKKEIDTHQFRNPNFDKNIESENGKKEIYTIMVNYIEGNKVAKSSYQEYLADLKTSEKNFNLSKDVESIFVREIERVYGILYDSYMVEKYNDFVSSDTTNNVIISEMLDLYENKVKADYTKYADVDDQTSTIKDSARGIYYYKDGIDWFTVSHILVKFNDEEQSIYSACTEALEDIENGIETEYSKKYYEDKIDDLYSNLKSIKRTETSANVYEDKGEEGLNATELLKSIKAQTKNKTSEEKIDIFTDLTYIYNEDTGLFSSDYNYVVGLDRSTGTVYSNWVESFNDAAVELYKNGDGKVGDVYSSVIKSTYGIHIMMYAGKVDNLFTGIDEDFTLENKDIKVLYDTKLKEGEDKTYFDLMYELCVPESTTIFEQLDINRLKSETTKIEYYPDAF